MANKYIEEFFGEKKRDKSRCKTMEFFLSCTAKLFLGPNGSVGRKRLKTPDLKYHFGPEMLEYGRKN